MEDEHSFCRIMAIIYTNQAPVTDITLCTQFHSCNLTTLTKRFEQTHQTCCLWPCKTPAQIIPRSCATVHTTVHHPVLPRSIATHEKWRDRQLGCLPSTHLADYILSTQTLAVPGTSYYHNTENSKPLNCPHPAGTQQVLAAHLFKSHSSQHTTCAGHHPPRLTTAPSHEALVLPNRHCMYSDAASLTDACPFHKSVQSCELCRKFRGPMHVRQTSSLIVEQGSTGHGNVPPGHMHAGGTLHKPILGRTGQRQQASMPYYPHVIRVPAANTLAWAEAQLNIHKHRACLQVNRRHMPLASGPQAACPRKHHQPSS